MRNMSLCTFFLACCLFFVVPFFAYADVLYQHNDVIAGPDANYAYHPYIQSLGAGMTGYVSRLAMYAAAAASSTQSTATHTFGTLVDCEVDTPLSGTCDEHMSVNTVNLNDGSSAAVRYYDFSSPIALDPTHYYFVAIVNGPASYTNIMFGNGSNAVDIRGSDGPTYGGYTCGDESWYASFGGGCDDMTALFFALFGSESYISDQSYIIGVTSPADGEVTASVDVEFRYDFYNSGQEQYDVAGGELWDLTHGNVFGMPEEVISTTGTLEYVESITLIASTTYRFIPILSQSSTTYTGYVYGIPVTFAVLEDTEGLVHVGGIPISGSTTSPDDLSGMFGLSQYIFAKFPFNWLVDGAVIFSDLRDETGTTTLPDFEVDLSDLQTAEYLGDFATSTMVVSFVSAQDFYDLADMAAFEYARSIGAGMLWLSLVMFGIFEARRLFARTQAG